MTCSCASGRSDSVPTSCPSLSPLFQGIISAFMPVHNRRFAAAALLMTDRLLTQGLLAAASPFGATPLVTLLKKGSLSRVPPREVEVWGDCVGSEPKVGEMALVPRAPEPSAGRVSTRGGAGGLTTRVAPRSRHDHRLPHRGRGAVDTQSSAEILVLPQLHRPVPIQWLAPL